MARIGPDTSWLIPPTLAAWLLTLLDSVTTSGEHLGALDRLGTAVATMGLWTCFGLVVAGARLVWPGGRTRDARGVDPVAVSAGGLLLGLALAGDLSMRWLRPWPRLAGALGLLLVVLATAGLSLAWRGLHLPARRWRIPWYLVLPMVALPPVVGLPLLMAHGKVLVDTYAASPLGRAGIGLVHLVGDPDGDGYPSMLGSDCRGLDPQIHPFATDLPGDGVDQDCDGRDAAPHPPNRLPDPHGELVGKNLLLVTMEAPSPYPREPGQKLLGPAVDLASTAAAVFPTTWTCSPLPEVSVACLLSGRYPPRLKLEPVLAWPDGRGRPATQVEDLPEGGTMLLGIPRDPVPTLAEVLESHDYLTMAVVSTRAMAAASGLTRGITSLQRSAATPEDAAAHGVGLLRGVKGRKFMLWVHLPAPSPGPGPSGVGPYYGDGLADHAAEGAFRQDLALGRVLGALERARLADRTLVVITGLRGLGAGQDSGEFARRVSVPTLFLGPGLVARRSEVAVASVDLLPTVLDLLGIPFPWHVDGRSLGRWLMGRGELSPRPAMAWDPDRRVRILLDEGYALRQDDLLGVTTLSPASPGVSSVAPVGLSARLRRTLSVMHDPVSGGRPGPL